MSEKSADAVILYWKIFECSVVFVCFFLILLSNLQLTCLPSNHQGDIKGRL